MLDWNNPAIIGLIIAIPSFILGYLGYRRSVKVDKTTEQSMIGSNQVGAVAQVIDGLNKLIDNLQEDNKLLRQSVNDLSNRLDKLRDEHLLLIKDMATMREEVLKYQAQDVKKIDNAKKAIKTTVDEKLEEIKK